MIKLEITFEEVLRDGGASMIHSIRPTITDPMTRAEGGLASMVVDAITAVIDHVSEGGNESLSSEEAEALRGNKGTLIDLEEFLKDTERPDFTVEGEGKDG